MRKSSKDNKNLIPYIAGALSQDTTASQAASTSGNGLAKIILDLAAHIPDSRKSESIHPKEAARHLASSAATKAALAAGSLALPVGALGWLTIVPEMLAIWKIQAQMVADIAAFYGKSSLLTQEHMLYCLFRHSAAQAVRDLVVRAGERLLVRAASLQLMQAIAGKIGVKISQQVLGKSLSRWLPVIGAVGVGGYAYYDTSQVAATAIALFEQEVVQAT